MDYARARLYLMLILLSSSALFPSAQQAFADHLDDMIIPPGTTEEIFDNHDATNITVGPGAELIIKDGGTLNLSGVLQIDNGGSVIIKDGGNLNLSGQLAIDNGGFFTIDFGGTLTFTGSDSNNLMVVNDGGHVEQYGALVSNNPLAFILNLGDETHWILYCGGTQELNGAIFQGELTVIECVNNPPIAGDDVDTVAEGGVTTTNVILNDSDADDGLDLASIVTVAPTFGTLVDNGDGTIEYTHDGSETLSDSYTYTINDLSAATSNVATVDITITPVNDIPVAGDDVDTVAEGGVTTTNVILNDSDADDGLDLASIVTVAPTFGTLVDNGDGTIEYTHDGSETLSDSYTYTINDLSAATSNVATVDITITPVNMPPTLDAISDPAAILEDATEQVVNLTGIGGDDSGTQTLTVTATSDNTALIPDPTVTYSSPDATGSLSYTPVADANGVAIITVTVSDGIDSAIETFTITVTSVNDIPVAGDDAASVSEGVATVTNVIANDSDADDGLDLASIAIVSGPTNGALVDNGDGTIQYTHDGSETTSDTYTYTIDDLSAATSNVATVDITIISGNDPPVATITSPSDNDIFFLGDPVDFVGTGIDPEDGDISSDLEWFNDGFTPIGNGASFTLSNLSEGTHTITLQIIDSVGLVDLDYVTITIQADLSNQLFCNDLTIAELERYAEKGKYNLIDNRNGPSSTLIGTDDDDLIIAGNFGDIIEARDGNDCVIGGSENDNIQGEDGNDEIFGVGGDDVINGNSGNDLLDGGNGGDNLFGGDGNDKIDGGNESDNIEGEAGNDDLKGGSGDDEIIGGKGNDRIDGGVGSDTIEGEAGDDHIKGGEGEDNIIGGKGNDKIDGGSEDDTILGNAGNDHIKGGEGDGEDEITGGAGNDKLEGGDGADTITGGSGNDHIKGGDGDDNIKGGADKDKIDGGNGNDIITGGSGNDHIKGGDGDDNIKGGADKDKIDGDDGNDIIAGQLGDDDLKGSGGNDELKGGDGKDKLEGGSGDDVLRGGDGNDYLKGGSGNDILKGQKGDDKLKGGDDDDTITGGKGNDKLEGQKGNDLLRGNAGDDELKGGDGDDDLKGQAGDDKLKGDKGTDSLNGGADSDTCYEDKDDTLINCEIIKPTHHDKDDKKGKDDDDD